MPGEPSPPSRLAWGVGVVACVVVAHCLAGAVKYGGEQRSVALQDASSFFALPQGTQRHMLIRSWERAIVPSEADTEKAAAALAKTIKSRDEVKRAVQAIRSTMRSAAAAQRRSAKKDSHSLALSAAQGTTMLAQLDGTNSVDSLGLDVGSFQHFEQAAQSADYYERHSKYAGAPRGSPLVAQRVREAAAREAAARKVVRDGRRAAVNAAMLQRVKRVARAASGALAASGAVQAEGARGRAGQANVASLLQPKEYPRPGHPFRQPSVDTEPVKTWDTEPGETCPSFIPNCQPQRNTLKSCDKSCGSYCQAIRGDGPCFSGSAGGVMSDCKFGYRGAPETPDYSVKDESGWLEGSANWAVGGPNDCMTCPVGFKVRPMYGDGTGPCVPCGGGDDPWIDGNSGQILEDGCAGGQFPELELGAEAGTRVASAERFNVVPGCLPPKTAPLPGAEVLAAVPEDLADDPFFKDGPDELYPARVQGADAADGKLAVKFRGGGPFVPLDPGVPDEVGEGFVPAPGVGDKVTVAAGYWEDCCEEEYDPKSAGPLRLGDVAEVTGAGGGSVTVLAPDGDTFSYPLRAVRKVLGVVVCPLPGYVQGNSVGRVSNALLSQTWDEGGEEGEEEGEEEGGDDDGEEFATEPNDPECCCCQRDLWVGCWGWCGDTTPRPRAKLPAGAPQFRAGRGAPPGEIAARPQTK